MFRTASAAVAALALGAVATPAFAGLSDDIETCRVAMDASGDVPMSDYRIKYKDSRGARVRTLKLKLDHVSDGPAYDVVCKVKQGEVVDLSFDQA